MKTIKKILKNKYFLIGLFTPIIVAALAIYLTWYSLDYMQKRDNQIFQDAWENGYMEGQNYQDLLNKHECFNISKNPQLNVLLERYFKDCKTAKIIWAIAQAESSGKQFAVGKNDNGTMDGGWLQVNDVHRNPGETQQQFINRMHDLEQNVALASIVYQKQGFRAWYTYRDGKYLQYMK